MPSTKTTLTTLPTIFINSQEIISPAYYTKYYCSNGEKYQRIESFIDDTSFNRDANVVRIELYRNCTDEKSEPELVKVVCRRE